MFIYSFILVEIAHKFFTLKLIISLRKNVIQFIQIVYSAVLFEYNIPLIIHIVSNWLKIFFCINQKH